MLRSKQALRLSRFLTLVLLSAIAGLGLLPDRADAQTNPVIIENQQPGSGGWEIDTNHLGTDAVGQIKGYASAASINKGDAITFRVSVNPAQTFTMDIYRMGWYNGMGGRLMQHVGPLSGTTQPACPMNATTGLRECSWGASYTLTVPSTWTSGVYVVTLINQQGYQNQMIFVVRDDNRVAPLLYQQPVTTYQAYNAWPNGSGKSLYDFNSFGAITVGGYKSAVKVSFDRPYTDTGISEDFFVSGGEINFIRFVEKNGYDIAYSTDVDTHANGTRILNYRGFLSVGHDEYWSKQMFDNVAAARDAGVNLGFFSGNDVYWQIRFEASSTGTPNRVIVCYRDATIDPNTDPTLETINFRDPPVNRPEQTLMGTMYTSIVPQNGNGLWAPYIVNNSSNWVYEGTGLKDGDSIPGVVGYEADKYFSGFPGPVAVPGTWVLLSHSPYTSQQGPDYSTTSVYQAPSGAWVFGSGTMNWNWALDTYQHGIEVFDTRLQKATQNILNRFIVNAQPDFSLSATPASQTVAPGGSTSYTVNVVPTGGFTGSATLSVSGLPAGANGSFTTNPTTGSSTLSITTDVTTPQGTSTLTITGVSGTLTRTATVILAVFPPDFTLGTLPSSRSITPGSSANYTVSIAALSGFNSQVSLGVSGLPAGAGASFSPNPATATSTLTVTTSASTPLGDSTLTITGDGGGLTRTATVTLSMVATPPPPVGVAFDAVGPSAGGASVASGSSLSWTHTVSTTGSGMLLTVAVAVGKTPDTGVSLTATYAGVPMTSAGLVHSNNSTSGFVQMFYLKAPTPGSNTVQVTLAGGTASLEGGSVSFANVDQTTPLKNITTKFGSGTTPNVAVASAPGDMVVDAMVTGCDGPMTSTQTLRWLNKLNCSTAGGNGAQSTAAGAASVAMGYTVPDDYWGMIGADIVAGSGAPAPFDFSITNQGNKSVEQGLAVTNTINATLTSGATQAVTFGVSGLPTGVTASFNGTSCSPTCSSVLTLTADPTAATGTSTITVTGTAGSTNHSTTFNLTVTAPQPFDFSITNSGNKSVNQGSSVTNTVTATLSSGATQEVTFSVSGLPSGVTGSYGTASCSPTCNSVLTLTADLSAAAGTSTITVTGTAGAITHSSTFNLTVVAQDFAVGATPASRTVQPGAGTSYTVTITPSGGFNGAVSLSASGLPTGANASFSINPATSTSVMSVTTTAATPSGAYTLTITGTSGTLTHTATVGLTVSSGTVTVTAPNTTVSWKASTTQSITFTHNMGVGVQMNIDVSRDGGTSWSPITVFTTTSATSGTYSWVVTGPPTTSARIRVTATANSLVTDMSDVNFTIVNPTITVTAPNTAVNWRIGDTKNITFSHTLGTGKTVNIEASRDGGATWALIAPFTTTSATSGTYAWVVSAPPTTQGRVRVTWMGDPTVTDTSDVNFTVLARATVTAPNTAVTWGAGSTRQITWTHNLGLGGLVDIEFSPDSGATWSPIALGVASNAATSGTYTGPMPSTVTTQALVRVSPAGNVALGDTSNVTFTLATPTITVTAPNTAVKWTVGTSQSLKWSHNLGTLDAVRIEIARDGVNYTEVISPSVTNSGNTSSTFTWVVTAPTTTTAKIRVTWLTNPEISDVSNVNFTIR